MRKVAELKGERVIEKDCGGDLMEKQTERGVEQGSDQVGGKEER